MRGIGMLDGDVLVVIPREHWDNLRRAAAHLGRIGREGIICWDAFHALMEAIAEDYNPTYPHHERTESNWTLIAHTTYEIMGVKGNRAHRKTASRTMRDAGSIPATSTGKGG